MDDDDNAARSRLDPAGVTRSYRRQTTRVSTVNPARPELVSGEGVAFDLNHASAGSRIVAAAIDVFIQIVLAIILFVVTGRLALGASTAAISALLVFEALLVFAGYPILFEWLTRGRTPGKLALGLRVVRDDSGPIGFRHAVVRGLAGLILEKPGILGVVTVGVGITTMIASPQDKRIGDMMAGTFVLNERGGPKRSLQVRDYAPPPQLIGWAQSLDLSRLDDQLALSVRQFVVRAPEMTPAAQHGLGENLRARVLAVIAPPPPPGTPTSAVLITVLAERRRRAGLAALGYLPGPSQQFAPRPFPAPGTTPPPGTFAPPS
jgi:uncharacterized RDD family membrane protein YckC